ncbi:MAG: STAS domain-containing protein [Ruminococcaceae bacterium]|nr:STAS domain-containing protein [Oscillospiraceae bacterium]
MRKNGITKEDFKLEVRLLGEKRALLVHLFGELDHHTAGEVKEEADRMLRSTNAVSIIFDFTQLSFMDSSGIGMIMGRYKKVRTLGGKVVAYGVNAQIMRIMEMSGIDKIIKLTTDYDRALRILEK